MNTEQIKKVASIVLIILLLAASIIHFYILRNLAPFDGLLDENDNLLRIFNIISIVVNIILLIVLMLRNNFIHHQLSKKLLNNMLWFFLVLFMFNTIGNLNAESEFQMYFAAPAFIYVALLWIIIRKDKV